MASNEFGFEFSRPAPHGQLWPLEASAGTGKTWNIQNFVADYIADGKAQPDEIVIVTFTRSATAELRARIRHNMVALVAGTRPPEIEERIAYEAHEKARVKDALGKFGQLRISTIHGFAQRSLSFLGEPLGTMTTDVDSEQFRSSVLRDVIRGLEPKKLDKLIAVEKYQKKLLEMLKLDANTPNGKFFASLPSAETLLLIEVAELARMAISDRKSQLGLSGYSDLLTRLNDRLERESDAQSLARTIKVLLIDEFQDTDSLQWEIFQKIHRAGNLHAFVVVGDPKQAIYGFRGGDVQVYREAVGTGVVNSLRGNRRSSAPLVDAANVFLGDIDYGISFKNKSKKKGLPPIEEVELVDGYSCRRVPIDYVTVVATGNLKDVTTKPAWVFRKAEGADADGIKDFVKRDLPGYIAGAMKTQTIPDPITGIERPIRYDDFCVLALNNPDIGDYLRALHAAGIPASVVGGANVFSSDAARQWRLLLGAIARPSRVSSARLLSWTWFGGKPAKDLATYRDSESWSANVQSRLFEWHEKFAKGDRFAFFDTVIRESGVLTFLSTHELSRRHITDIQHIAEILRSRPTDSLDQLVEFLQESMGVSNGDEGDPDAIGGKWSRRIDGDEPAVQLMTVHQSKGLQFPIVLIPYLAKGMGPGTSMMSYRAFRDDRAETLIDLTMGEKSPANVVKSALRNAEHFRKVYVALTRAQVRNVMWTPDPNNWQAEGVMRNYSWRDERTKDGSNLFGWDEVARSTPAKSDSIIRGREVSTSTVALPSAPLRLSYTAITDYVTSDINDGSPADREPTDSLGGVSSATSNKSSEFQGLSGSALLGKVVHRVLQTINVTSGDDRDFVEPAVTAAAKEFGFALDKKEKGSWSTADVVDLVITSLTGQLGDVAPGTTLADYGDERRLPEMGFDFNLGDGVTVASLISVLRQHLSDDPLCGPWLQSLSISDKELAGFMTGSIDAVLAAGESDDPRFFIVDYKSNGLRDFSTEGLHRAMSTHHYQLQALIYLVALHRFVRSRLGDAYDYDRHIAGAAYLFLRGMKPDVPGAAVVHLRPSRQCIDDLSNLLNGDVDVA